MPNVITTIIKMKNQTNNNKMIKCSFRKLDCWSPAGNYDVLQSWSSSWSPSWWKSRSKSRSWSWSWSRSKLTHLIFWPFIFVILFSVFCVNVCARSHHYHRSTQLQAKVGSYVVFNCYVDFPYDLPIPYIVHWNKDKKNIFTWYEGETTTNEFFNGRLHLIDHHSDYGRATVNLTAIRESDQGWYHCQIIFPNRTPSMRNNGTWYNLTVQGGSLIKIPPINQTLMEGQTAFFHCVMKHPDSSETFWYKDGVLLQDIPDLMRRSYMGPQGSLSIDPTMMTDYGEYECQVRSNDSEVQSAKAFLNIQYKAKVIYAPPEVYLPYGQPAVLDCHFRANPPLKNLRWEKDGLLFDSYNVPGVYYKMNGSLYFSKVDENYAGSYTCTPFNELGTDGPSPMINVIVLKSPTFTITPKAIYIQKLGETIELPCQATDRDGTNHATIDWKRKDDKPLPSDRIEMNGGNLTIKNLHGSDRGLYQCIASNEAATISTETELMIENITPRAPYNLTANSTQTSITISWQPGYIRPNLEYTVWYRLTDAAEWRTMRVLHKNIMETTVQHLLPGREYELMILSQDKHGDGMFSKQIRYSTKSSEVAKDGIENVKNVATEQQKYQERKQQQQHQYEYQQYDRHSSNSHINWTKYNINSNKTKNAVIAPLSSSLSAPWNLSAINNQQGWLLHWEHPLDGLDLLHHYTVCWWREPEHQLIGSVDTYDNYYQIRYLKEEAQYHMQVFAVSVDGHHIPSNVFIIDVPSQRKARMLLIGSSVGVAFLLCALIAFLYMKRNCLRHFFAGRHFDDDDDINDDDDDDDIDDDDNDNVNDHEKGSGDKHYISSGNNSIGGGTCNRSLEGDEGVFVNDGTLKDKIHNCRQYKDDIEKICRA